MAWTPDSVIRGIIKEIAEETGLPEDLIDKVNKSQFKFARGVMAKGDKVNVESFSNIFWQHLGKMAIRPSRVKQMNAKNAGDKDTK